MERWQGRVALVTGASAGMGAAITKRLVEEGMIVIGCARNIEHVQAMSEALKTSKGSLHAMRCDVRKEESILAMFSEIKTQHGGVDVCINNAGLGFTPGSILYGDTEQWREMVDVNVMGLAICTREAIKSMRERKVDDGHIIQIGSFLAFDHAPFPDFHWYGATKWMARALTDCLRMELRAEKSRIKVTGIHPGLTRTEFLQRMVGEEAANELLKTFEMLSAEKIADAVVSALGTTEEVEIEDLIVMPKQGITT